MNHVYFLFKWKDACSMHSICTIEVNEKSKWMKCNTLAISKKRRFTPKYMERYIHAKALLRGLLFLELPEPRVDCKVCCLFFSSNMPIQCNHLTKEKARWQELCGKSLRCKHPCVRKHWSANIVVWESIWVQTLMFEKALRCKDCFARKH